MTNSARFSNRTLALLLLAGAVLIVLGLAGLTLLPGPTLRTSEGETQIYVETNRRFVAAPGGCVTARWELEHIQSVRLGDDGRPGTGEEEICLDHDLDLVWHVVLPDGTNRDYRLPFTILTQQPVVWLAMLAALVLVVCAGYLTVGRGLAARLAWTVAPLLKLARGLTIPLLGVIVTLLILEFALRFYFTRFGSEEDRVLYVYSSEEIQSKTARFIGLPYVGYGPSPDFPEHNQFGYRGPAVTLPKPEGVFRIVTLGASTTYGFGVTAAEAYPAQLQKVLREEHGYANVEVVNGGVMGYTSWETLANLEFRALELEPDLIIFYEAINDVEVREKSPACYTGVHPLRGLNVFHGLWKTEFDALSPSTLYRFIAFHVGWMPNPGALDFAFEPSLALRDCIEAVPVSPEAAVKANPPVYFERNLRSMIAIAQAHGIQMMISRWIYPTADLVSFALPDYALAAAEEHNTLARRLSEEMNVPYYDLAADFKYTADQWWSAVHMTPQGTHQQAELYAAFLVENDLLHSAA
jgi:lysophospholipase L1-like esterase